jgi:TolA-binding protein
MADALEATGQKDAARAFLQVLSSEFPDNERIRKRLLAVGP